MAVTPAPDAMVSNPVTFSWPPIAGTKFEYGVTVLLPGSEVIRFSGTTIDGTWLVATLPPRDYQWTLSETPVGLYDGTSELKCRSSASQGTFVVQ